MDVGRGGSVAVVDAPTLLQTGPETFQVFLGHGRTITASLPHHTRRGLGLTGVAPLAVATEIVRFLQERGELSGTGATPERVSLGVAAGRYPEFVDELRSRLG